MAQKTVTLKEKVMCIVLMFGALVNGRAMLALNAVLLDTSIS
jgi:hypothetical protein